MRLDEILAPWAATGKVAFHLDGPGHPDGDGGATVGYDRLAQRIGSTEAGLEQAGVGRGDRVAFCGLNRIELFDALFACARIGAILMPLNNRLTASELGWQIDDADPALLLTTDGFAPLIAEAAGTRPVRDLDDVPFGPDPGPHPDPDRGGTDTDDVLMVYTSGTTGHPKGAVLTQSALHHTIDNSVAWQGLTTNDRILAVLPTFHVGGLNIQVLPALSVGAGVVLHRRFEPGAALAAIARHRPTHTVFVPTMLTAVASHPDFDVTDLSCLTAVSTGSSVVPRAAMTPFFDRGVAVAQVYGATETGPTAVAMPFHEASNRPTSCGLPARHTGVRVVDPDTGQDRPPGVDGEVWLRGPNLFDRYWRNPDATAAAFAEEWYRTGDIGRLDSDGYLWISDRRDDLIVSGGENIYPAEVEAVLAEHPAIAEVAVVGQPDDRWGQVPVAVVVTSGDDVVTVEDLRRWSDGRLARYKQPRRVAVVDALPRTSLGKVRKHLVRLQLDDS